MEFSGLINEEELTPEALKLPVGERALLTTSLWENLEDPYFNPPDPDDEHALNLALQRDQEIESGTVAPLTHSELMALLRK